MILMMLERTNKNRIENNPKSAVVIHHPEDFRLGGAESSRSKFIFHFRSPAIQQAFQVENEL
jgi:hypothetical protein